MELEMQYPQIESTISPDNMIFSSKKSHIRANTLFTFVKKSTYFYKWIKEKTLYATYVKENYTFTHSIEIKKLAIPMKCFCDINLHQLKYHVADYGAYGLAFDKSWGIKNGIQPVQYINPESRLSREIGAMLDYISENNDNIENGFNEIAFQYFMHQLLYYKPYSGANSQGKERCFADECEWRFIPDQVPENFYHILNNPFDLQDSQLKKYNDMLVIEGNTGLKFEYSDLKYVIVRNRKSYNKVCNLLRNSIKDDKIFYDTLSKIIVWDESKEDF